MRASPLSNHAVRFHTLNQQRPILYGAEILPDIGAAKVFDLYY